MGTMSKSDTSAEECPCGCVIFRTFWVAGWTIRVTSQTRKCDVHTRPGFDADWEAQLLASVKGR